MMSEICGEDVINRLFSLSTVNIEDKEWPIILAWIERKENIHCLPKVSEAIFGTVLNKFDINTVENKVLRPVLLFLKKIFLSSISYTVTLVKIHSNNQNNEVSSELCQLLEVCLNVLGGYFILIDNLAKLGGLKQQYVKSVTITLPSVLLASFNHCQESEKLYGVYFSSATDLLTALFRKSYEISILFYKWIDEYITFDFKMEDDTNILIKALETLYSVGEIVVQLDVKTMVEYWKGLIKITCKYACSVKERLDISHPMKFLASSLEDVITEMTQQKEINEKLRIRNLKLASFILKVVVKLCEVYNGFLNGCEVGLLNLLLLLNRCSRLGRKNNNGEMERFIVVGAAPLLFHLLDDRSFLARYNSLSNNLESLSSEAAVGFLFTHLRLLKFLISSNEDEVKESWLKIPLVSNIMSLFSMCYSVLNLNIKIEDSDAYTYLVSTTAAFMISSFTPEKFFEVESIILNHLFNSRIETGILASDLLCLLGRLTNEEVCLNQTKFICQILCNMDWSGIQRPEACVVGLTVGRLFHLLSGNGQETIAKQFQPSSNPHLWLYLNCDFEITHNMISNVSLLKETQNLSPLNYVHMMELIALYKNISVEECNNKLNYYIKQLWSGFETYRSDDRQPDWWFYIFFLLTKFISMNKKMSSFITGKVLNDLLELTFLKQSSINYYICIIMKNLAPSVSFQNCSTVSDIFINCISSDNFLIKQLAIESFVHFSDNSHDINKKNDINIIGNVSSNPNIEYYLSDYYKKIPICTANSIINFSYIFFHKCFVYDKDIHPNKKFKHNSENQEIRHLLCNFLECVNLIKEFTKQRELSPAERKIINVAISDLEKL